MTTNSTQHFGAHEVVVPVNGCRLRGDLIIPSNAAGFVLFAHGSGSSRHSPRNRQVAAALCRHGFGSLLIDLLTPEEEEIDRYTSHIRFNIPLLADRLIAIIDWLRSEPETSGLKIGLFGASTGGGAAIIAAAHRPEDVAAVVSRGGRPDLAGEALARIDVPTLLIVGERDPVVIDLNQEAQSRIGERATLRIVPKATHLFEEPGALAQVAELASEWFRRYLTPAQPAPQPANGVRP